MRSTDEAIRHIEADFTKISRSQTLINVGVTLNTGVGVLCQCATNEYIKEVGKILVGGSVLPSALKYFLLNADKKAAIDKTPFYFPWLVHREATKFALK